MATRKQRDANRRNAQNSTGPRTSQGKAAITSNALKHGFYSNHVLDLYEDAADFAAVQADFFSHLQPEGPIELELAARIVLSVWQLRRIQSAETQALTLDLVCARNPETGIASVFNNCEDELLGFAFQSDIRSDRPQFDGFARHFARWERTYYRALHELERIQLARRSHAVPPPQVVEVHSDAPAAPNPAQGPDPDRDSAPGNTPNASVQPQPPIPTAPATPSKQTPDPQNGFVPKNRDAHASPGHNNNRDAGPEHPKS